MKNRLPLIAAAALMLSSALLAGCKRAGGGEPDTESAPKPVVQVSLASVERATLQATIPVTGTVAPLPNMEAKVAPLAAGRISRMYVRVGDTVAKGQVLATLESGPLLGQIQQAEATVRADAATLQQARLNLRSQQSSQSSAVAEARTNLRAQQVALDRLLAGSRPQEIAQAQQGVTSAQAALTSADQSLSRSRTLFAEGLLARKDLEAAEAQQQSAAAQLRSAQAALSLAREGNRPQDIQAGRVAVQQAQEQLRAAQAQNVQNAAKAQDVRVAERQLEGAQGSLRSAQAQMSALTIRAPVAGTVVGQAPNPGEALDTTGTVATIVNLDRVRLLLSIPAGQITAVQPGQTVEFSTETRPDVTYRARVTVITRAVDPATNTVAVEAIADNPGHQLSDDAFVRGRLVTRVEPGALTAPTAAVVEKDGKPTVFVVDADNVAHARPVGVGVKEGSRVQILSGLSAGEKVVTTGAYELEDGTRVKAEP